jgi:peptidylamidoglycolate lyase
VIVPSLTVHCCFSTFNSDDTYAGDHSLPIDEETIYELDPITGSEIRKWGENMFYVPHGLSIDNEGNYWITDVALHQVFKFGPGRGRQPLLVMGTKFEPGSARDHFCKPTSVAVHSKTKEIFVADGYCNSRLIKFSSEGQYMMHWGHGGLPPDLISGLSVPHKVVLVEQDDRACISDREHGVIKCLKTDGREKNDVVVYRQSDWDRLFSISFAKCLPIDLLFAVTGPSFSRPNMPIEAYAVPYRETSEVDQKIVTHFAPHQKDKKDATVSTTLCLLT